MVRCTPKVGRRTATMSMQMDSGSMKMERSRPVRIEVTRAARQQTATEAAYQEAVRGIPAVPAVPAAAIREALEATVILEITVIPEITEMPGMTEIRTAEMPEITEALKIQTSRRWFRW